MLLAAGVLFGLGLGTAQPALFALGGDLVPPSERGTAMASLGIFMELGIGGGGTVTGILTRWSGSAQLSSWPPESRSSALLSRTPDGRSSRPALRAV